MNQFEIAAILGATTEKDAQPGKWGQLKGIQAGLVDDLRLAPQDALQELADWCYWSIPMALNIDQGLMTGPRANPVGCARVVELARERGLTVPKAGPECLFEAPKRGA